jgi:hypothetical protein
VFKGACILPLMTSRLCLKGSRPNRCRYYGTARGDSCALCRIDKPCASCAAGRLFSDFGSERLSSGLVEMLLWEPSMGYSHRLLNPLFYLIIAFLQSTQDT